MKTHRPQLTVSYRVLDASGHTLEVIKLTGPNKRYLLWKAQRLVEKRYGKAMKLHQYKVVGVA
jgi:hypothetical protein